MHHNLSRCACTYIHTLVRSSCPFPAVFLLSTLYLQNLLTLQLPPASSLVATTHYTQLSQLIESLLKTSIQHVVPRPSSAPNWAN